jgi:hypothetical protein
MERRFLLDVVIAKGSTVFELFTGKDQSLLVWWDTLLVLNFRLDIVDGIARLDLEGDGFTSKSLDEDLHTSTKSENEMEGRLFLNV